MIWCIGEAIVSPAGFTQIGAILRPFAVVEALRIVFCVELFVFAAFYVPVSQHRAVATGLLSVGSLVALLALISSGQEWSATPQSGLNSIFGNHEQFGSYILMLLPAAIVLSLRKSSSQALTLVTSGLTIILAAGLLYARTRSCWIGMAVAAVAMILLMVRYSPTTISAANRFLIVGPAMVILIGFVGLSMTGDLGTVVKTRASSFSSIEEDKSLADRLHRWKAACRMTYERPIAGWGLGTYPVLQQKWTGTGDDPDSVIEHGTGHQNIAHNFWVQWAAETGGVGVFLYVTSVIAFLIFVTRSLASGTLPETGSMLIIGAATLIAASIDMFGSPSYSFPGVSCLPWLWMGFAVGGFVDEESSTGAEPEPTPAWAVIVPIAVAALVLAAILWVGYHQPGAIRS
jgi:O-antigen ligase